MSKPRTYVTIVTSDDVEFRTINRDVHDRRTLVYILTLAKTLKPGNKVYFGAYSYELKSEAYTGYMLEVILKSYISLYRCSGATREKVGVDDLKYHFKNIGG